MDCRNMEVWRQKYCFVYSVPYTIYTLAPRKMYLIIEIFQPNSYLLEVHPDSSLYSSNDTQPQSYACIFFGLVLVRAKRSSHQARVDIDTSPVCCWITYGDKDSQLHKMSILQCPGKFGKLIYLKKQMHIPGERSTKNRHF